MTFTCPKCGCREFDIAAQISTTCHVVFDDDDHEVIDDEPTETTWDDDSSTTCRGCGHNAPLGQMVAP